MAMSGRETNTMEEIVQKMLRLITDAKVAPDADMPFLIQLETQLLDYVKAPLRQAGVDTSAMPGEQMPPGAPADQGGMMGAMQGFSPTPGPGVPGVRSMPQMPNPDELRRLVSQ